MKPIGTEKQTKTKVKRRGGGGRKGSKKPNRKMGEKAIKMKHKTATKGE
jgi:hypothetical protein